MKIKKEFLNKIKTYIKQLISALGQAFRLLVKNDPLRLGGATAFFTSFALPPILLLLIQLLSLWFNKGKISNKLFSNLGNIVGSNSVNKLEEVLEGIKNIATNWTIAIFGFLFLLFIATTLFKVIQSSLNQLWSIKKDNNKRFKRALLSRLKSTLGIAFTGLLFLASLLAESLKIVLGKYLLNIFPNTGFYLNNGISSIISVITVTVWFSVLFRYLPDGRPTWRVALAGGLLTGILFNIGKVVIKILLPGGNIDAVYGKSASLVLLLLFIFYSSIIFYYGADFTKIWAKKLNTPIQPLPHASLYKEELEENGTI